VKATQYYDGRTLLLGTTVTSAFSCNVTVCSLLSFNGHMVRVVKIKESLNKPDVAHKVPVGLESQFSMKFGT
jgi:hypothetical protein